MAKHASKSDHLQLVEAPPQVSVQIPLSVLSALCSAEDAFFELCFDAGRQVLAAMLEQDRELICGPKGKHDPNRRASRSGSTPSEITFGGRRIAIRRPRVRGREGSEIPLPSLALVTDRDPLDQRTAEAVACGVSTRKYARSLEPLPAGELERSVSKSSVSRRFVALTQKQLTAWLSKPLGEIDLRVIMIDGKVFHDHTVLIALGFDSEGNKHVLSLREGTTENSAVAKALLRDLLERGFDANRKCLFVTDGAKALRAAIRKVFGPQAVFQRCQFHKQGNILEHLPDHRRRSVKRVLDEAWEMTDASLAKRRLENLASSLETEHPSAAGSIREGLEETLTLQRLGVRGALYKTFRTTNPIENLNSSVGRYTRNVKRWRSGSMIVRWVGAAIVEAEKGFRKIRGYRDLPALIASLTESGSGAGTPHAQQVA